AHPPPKPTRRGAPMTLGVKPAEFEPPYAIPAPAGPGDERIQLAQARLEDLVIAVHAGLATATVTTVGPDAITAGLRAAAVLNDSDLPPHRTCPDLVTLADSGIDLRPDRRAAPVVALPDAGGAHRIGTTTRRPLMSTSTARNHRGRARDMAADLSCNA